MTTANTTTIQLRKKLDAYNKDGIVITIFEERQNRDDMHASAVEVITPAGQTDARFETKQTAETVNLAMAQAVKYRAAIVARIKHERDTAEPAPAWSGPAARPAPWLPDTDSDTDDAACDACEIVKVRLEDHGIGPYEFGGQKCVDRRMVNVADTEEVTVDLTNAIARDVADLADEYTDVRDNAEVTAKLKGVTIVDRDGKPIEGARIIAEYGIEVI